MADYSEAELQRGVPVATRVPPALHAELERQAAELLTRFDTGQRCRKSSATGFSPLPLLRLATAQIAPPSRKLASTKLYGHLRKANCRAL